MKSCRYLLLVITLVLAAAASRFSVAQLPSADSPGAVGSTSTRAPLQYTLPPDKLQKAYALYLLNGTLYFVTTIYGFLVLYLMLGVHFGLRLRDLAERASRFRFVQALIVMSLFILALQVLELPFDAYNHQVELKYGLSVQHWPSWFGDWGKGLLLGMVFASILGWILYAVLRRSPRRWWFYFWLATIPVVIFVIFIAPVFVEPLFNKFEPLGRHHADLVDQIERVVHRAGMDIPRHRMFEMKASEKTTQLNAYVSGFGSTKRVVVWDTTMEHLTIPQTLFVFGHEMGHYVLGHIPKQLTLFLVLFLLLFYLSYRVCSWLLERYGGRWGIRTLGDWASLPMLVLVLSIFTFFATPAFNAISRYFEHQADQYGLEVVHGLFPDSGVVAARSFQALGERSLDYPYVSRLAEFWSWNHPTIRDRVIYSQAYDPWGEGRQPEFVKDEPK